MSDEITEVNTAEEKEQAQVAQQSADAQQEKQGADLNISDLIALKNILEVASSRGAFKPNEFEAVGKTFNKLNAFLEAVSNNQKES